MSPSAAALALLRARDALAAITVAISRPSPPGAETIAAVCRLGLGDVFT